ncbi:MAG: hypothetical protein COS89_02700 [Deltaproteobacteria bacterium CG07_land_8_20_14_0_80_38_7]|nr:MAG: hypothetical protein COS89_02700 [Deltaproteobacteria bacterium CG07_land_8_20_14_0_80_38_7]
MQKQRLCSKYKVFVLATCFSILMYGFIGCSGSSTTDNTGEEEASGTEEGGGTSTGAFSQTTLTVGGESRAVSFYVPTNAGSNPPLVIAFHGTSGSPDNWIDALDSDPSGIEGLADAHGLVVAAPQSRTFTEADWDHEYGGDIYWETAAPNGSNPDLNEDLMLVRSIISSAQTNYNINTKRVYLIGFSNGGFFAVLAAMALPDEIAAFTEGGSGLVTCDTTRTCEAQSTATNCSGILSGAPVSCTSCSGSEKPITIPTSGRLVPGFLAHNNSDETVSSYYTCKLEQRMNALGYNTDVLIGNSTEHGAPEGFLDAAWAFMSNYELP